MLEFGVDNQTVESYNGCRNTVIMVSKQWNYCEGISYLYKVFDVDLLEYFINTPITTRLLVYIVNDLKTVLQ